MATAFLFVNLLLLGVCIGLLVHYRKEKKLVRDFAFHAVGKSTEPIEAVLSMAGEIFRTTKVWHRDQSFIPLPIFSVLGVTPGSILRTGGCCSDITRLTIVSLDALGFTAGSITLCPASGEARHCLVEVSLPKYNLLIDPTYGFYYVDEQGGWLGLSHLRSGTSPSFARLPHSTQSSYPSNSYYDFDYSQSKTANWTQSRIRKAMYHWLHFMTQGAIDCVKQPPLLEWPQIVLATSISVLLLGINLASLLFE